AKGARILYLAPAVPRFLAARLHEQTMPRRHDDTPKIDPRDFKAQERERARLAQLATSIPAVYASDDDYEAQLARHVRRLSELQELLYASDVYALLAVFQGMDTSGKD